MCPSATKPPSVPLVDDIDSPIYVGGMKLAKELAQMRIAHEAIMVEDARELLKLNRANTYNVPATPDTGAVTLDKIPPGVGENEMHVGDVVHNHYHDTTEEAVEAERKKAELSTKTLEERYVAERSEIQKQYERTVTEKDMQRESMQAGYESQIKASAAAAARRDAEHSARMAQIEAQLQHLADQKKTTDSFQTITQTTRTIGENQDQLSLDPITTPTETQATEENGLRNLPVVGRFGRP